jgi:hypothetical protein
VKNKPRTVRGEWSNLKSKTKAIFRQKRQKKGTGNADSNGEKHLTELIFSAPVAGGRVTLRFSCGFMEILAGH